MIQPSTLFRRSATLPRVSVTSAVAAVYLVVSLGMLPLLLFAAHIIGNPLFWAATPLLFAPELALIVVMSVSALMALLLVPTLVRGLRGGTITPAVMNRHGAWLMAALIAASLQVVYAAVFSAFNCG